MSQSKTNQWLAALLLQLACLLTFATTASAETLLDRQNKTWQPPGDAIQVQLWPKGPPTPSTLKAGQESYGLGLKQIGGRPYTAIDSVSQPTMAIFRPQGKDTGATVVVFPGGGYRVLAIDLEGTEICDWLTSKGITCVLLKYRVPGSGPYWNEECNCRRIPDQPYALQDAQRAIGLLRASAEEFGVNPHKIGVIGFSAGGHMVADVSNHQKRSYPLVDEADRQSSQPDFAMALYPGHLWKKPGFTLEPSIKIAADCPPTLIIAASDDPTDDPRHSLTYYFALQQAKIPVEMHLYAHGGHAFALRTTSGPVSQWPEAAEKWMRSIGMLPHKL